MENQKSINQIYTFKNKKHEEPFQELLAKENYELIEKKVPDIILKVINITWPLHTFTFFIENEQTNISTVLPIYDLVIDRIQVQGEKYELPNLASILIQFLNKRFKETGRFELLQISYLLSPIGRNSLKKNPDPVENAINMDFYELPIGSSEEKVKQLIKKYHIETSNDYIYHENETYELSNIQLDLSEIAEIQKTIAESIADIIDIGKEIVVFFQEIVIMTEELIDNDVNDIAEQIDNFFHASYDFFIQYQISFESFEYLKENKLMTLPKKSWVSVLNKTLDYLEKEKVISDLIIISELFEIHYENQMEEIDLISDDILLSISMYKLKKSSSSLWDGFETVQMLGAEQVTIFGVAQMAKNLQYNENEMNALLEAWFSEYEVTRNSSNAIQISVIHKIKEKLHPILYWISIKKLLPNWEQFADIAIRFLSLPVSESGCERVFSLRRRIISHLHTRISTKQQYARTFIINDSRQ